MFAPDGTQMPTHPPEIRDNGCPYRLDKGQWKCRMCNIGATEGHLETPKHIWRTEQYLKGNWNLHVWEQECGWNASGPPYASQAALPPPPGFVPLAPPFSHLHPPPPPPGPPPTDGLASPPSAPAASSTSASASSVAAAPLATDGFLFLEVAALQAKLIALTKKSAELEDGMNQQKLEIEQKTAELEDGMKQRQLEIEALTEQTMKQQLAIQELTDWLSWKP